MLKVPLKYLFEVFQSQLDISSLKLLFQQKCVNGLHCVLM